MNSNIGGAILTIPSAIATTEEKPKIISAWLVNVGSNAILGRFTSTLMGSPSNLPAVEDGDGFLIVDQAKGGVVSFARLYRKRSTLDSTIFYFDAVLPLTPAVDPSICGISASAIPVTLSRMDWTVFSSALKKIAGLDFSGMPILKAKSPLEQAYLRELLQLATVDDLLGPACGPEEEIVGMSVRDRYLVGKLAPRTRGDSEAVEGLKGVSAEEDASGGGTAPKDLKPFEETGEGKKKAAKSSPRQKDTWTRTMMTVWRLTPRRTSLSSRRPLA